MANTDDLWPANIADSKLTTPVAILKEQAALLGEKTKQLVKGEVSTQTTGNLFVHHFYIVAPTLNYKYELFTASHVINFYPLTLRQFQPEPHHNERRGFQGEAEGDSLVAAHAERGALDIGAGEGVGAGSRYSQ
jgi:hypothetical protein